MPKTKHLALAEDILCFAIKRHTSLQRQQTSGTRSVQIDILLEIRFGLEAQQA